MSRRLSDVDLYKTYKLWQEGSKYFMCFVRATNFVSLKHYDDFELIDYSEYAYEDNKIRDIINEYDYNNTLFLMEFSSVKAVYIALMLNKHLGLKPIPTFNNILHPYGIIGGKEYISSLINCGEMHCSRDTKGYVFILDRDRYRECSNEELQTFFNNQYELTYEDLPVAEMLSDLGYNKVVYISDNEPKEDIIEYLKYLKESKINVVKEIFEF